MNPDSLDELLGDFLLEAEERSARVEQLLLALAAAEPAERRPMLEEIRRQLHTLKGNAGMMGFGELQDQAHALEDRVAALAVEAPETEALLGELDRWRHAIAELAPGAAEQLPDAAEQPPAGERQEASVRVPLGRLETLTGLAAELVTSRNRLQSAMAGLGDRLLSGGAADDLAAHRLDAAWRAHELLLDGALYEIRGLRMVPFRALFGRLRRLVHDEAGRQGKEVVFEAFGGDTPLDRSLVESAGEALGHLVRNAVVHGIEAADDRRRAGKPRAGTVSLRASVSAGSVWLEVVDDGAGVDQELLLEAARRGGHAVAEDGDLTSLLFVPGVTTRRRADLAAGRGEGLAAVREVARSAAGDVEVASLPGVGSRFALRLPLSVATTEALLVESDGEEYALPAPAILETVSRASLGAAGGSEWRGRPLPLVDLGALLGTSAGGRRPQVAVVESEGRVCGLEVDRLGELLELVIQDLEGLDELPRGLAAASILGDGRVVPILDPPELVASAAARGAAT